MFQSYSMYNNTNIVKHWYVNDLTEESHELEVVARSYYKPGLYFSALITNNYIYWTVADPIGPK